MAAKAFFDLRFRAFADGHHRDHGGDPDDDAEGREKKRPHLVAKERPHGDAQRESGFMVRWPAWAPPDRARKVERPR